MTGDFTCAGSFAAKYAASGAAGGITASSKSSKAEKRLKRLFVLAGIILAAELIWLFGLGPFIPFSTIEVHGFAGFDRAEILACANINENSSYISVNVKDAQKRLSAINTVESARVTKNFPDKLSIFLEPRKAAAVTLAYSGGRQLPLYIDRKGVIYETGDANMDTGLPLLSGLEFDQQPLGMRLPAALNPLLENISRIAANSPELLAAVSEIRIDRKAWDRFELVIYPVHSSIRVRLENNLTEDILRYMLLTLDVFKSRSYKPDEIDYRSGMSSYLLKGASSGK